METTEQTTETLNNNDNVNEQGDAAETTQEPMSVQDEMDQRMQEAAAFFEQGDEEPAEEATEPTEEPVETQPEEQPKERPADKALREREQQDAIARYEAQLAEYKQHIERQQRLDQLKKENPLEYLKESGLTLDQLTDHILNNQPKEPTVQELQQQLEEYKRQQQQAVIDAQNEQIRQTVKANIAGYIENQKEQLKVVSSLNLGEEVFNRIVESAQTARSDADLLSIEQASKQVEDEFRTLYNELHRIFGSNTQQAPAPTPRTPQKPTQSQPRQDFTLTNDLDANIPDKLNEDELSPAQLMERRLAQAAKMFSLE